jgi:hypothetical protein
MLTQKDYSNDARVARIAANKLALAALENGSDAQATAKNRAYMATPGGQGLPSTNEHPNGWTVNSWTDPAFAGWVSDANGLLQPPAYTPPVAIPPKPIRKYGVPTKDPVTGEWFKWTQWPFGDDWKVACDPPAVQPTSPAPVSLKEQIVAYVQGELQAQPPKPQAVTDALIGVANFVATLEG